MAQIVNVDTLVPWDLTLTIDGEKCRTIEPDVGELRELAKLEKNLKGSQSAKMVQRLRLALKKFVHKDAHATINKAGFFTLESAMLVASAYFEAWQKKKTRRRDHRGTQGGGRTGRNGTGRGDQTGREDDTGRTGGGWELTLSMAQILPGTPLSEIDRIKIGDAIDALLDYNAMQQQMADKARRTRRQGQPGIKNGDTTTVTTAGGLGTLRQFMR